jgi:large subunit ribosomal protein L3
MVTTVFATKIGMSQAWTTDGKRLPVTKCVVRNNAVLRSQSDHANRNILEVGFGVKKLSNMKKPLRSRIEKSGFDSGVLGMAGVLVNEDVNVSSMLGSQILIQDVLSVGDIVKVQGTSKGRGFAGGIKRHGFSGGPKTHGQSDRERAVGSIGAGTSPGRVWKGKKMPGHYGVETTTVQNLVVVYINQENQEVWLSGPVPGSKTSIIRIERIGKTKKVDLNVLASGISKISDVSKTFDVSKTSEPDLVESDKSIETNKAIESTETAVSAESTPSKPETTA